jgi:hypothetical protein
VQNSPDPLGAEPVTSTNSVGTPVLFRVEFTPFTIVEISMQSRYGLILEQAINGNQLPDEQSPIAKWSGGYASFDPLRLINESSVGAQFHVRLSIDFEQGRVMAEIIPCAGFQERLNPFPAGSFGTIASPFIAVTNLTDYNKDPNFDGNLHYKIFVRTNGNTDVDNASAPGGTLRYIDREFTNVQVSFNKPIEFPPIPQVPQGVFSPDDFDDGTIAPFWYIQSATGLDFKEEGGVLKLTGNQTETGTSVSEFRSTDSPPRQNATVTIDFQAPTGIQTNTFCMFRVYFDAFNYFEIGIYEEGYALTRCMGTSIDAMGTWLPLFGDETTKFHTLKLSYKDDTGHIDAFIDDVQLDGIEDKQFSPSFTQFGFAFYLFGVEGQYIEREWDNFTSSMGATP